MVWVPDCCPYKRGQHWLGGPYQRVPVKCVFAIMYHLITAIFPVVINMNNDYSFILCMLH